MRSNALVVAWIPLIAGLMVASAPEPVAAGRKLIAITPLPVPDPAVVAAEGKIVRSISITGNKVTKEYIIDREVEHEIGHPFSLETMVADRTRLDNLGIFSFVAITPEAPGADSVEALGADSLEASVADSVKVAGADSVDVEVMVREMPWLIPYPALKISDQTGFTIGPALSSMNLLGRDITLAGRVMFGGATTYQVNLDWPWITGNHVSLTMFAAHILRNDDVREFDETSDEISPWVGTYVGRSGRLRAGYSYFHMKSDQEGITLSDDKSDSFHRLGAAAGYDTRDSWVNPHRGWDSEVQTLRSFGESDFWTTDLDVTRYQPIGKNTFVINGLASLQSGDFGVDVPIYMDYVMGGANSIRGYQVDELGKELSGKNQLITTLEYQYLLWDVREIALYGFPITMGVELAAFIDTGLAWNTSNQFNTDHSRTGYGFGIRTLLPTVGEVRFDLGFSGEGDVEFHFATWPKFIAQRQRLR